MNLCSYLPLINYLRITNKINLKSLLTLQFLAFIIAITLVNEGSFWSNLKPEWNKVIVKDVNEKIKNEVIIKYT